MDRDQKRYFLTFNREQLRCEEHFHRGDLPCPWPNCPNGTPHYEIVGVLMPDKTGMPFVRRRWQALDGSERFAWDEPEESAFFSAPPLVRAELERVMSSVEFPKTVYHYTTVDGLFGILNSGDLWLTDYEFLNDATEVRHGLSLLSELLAESSEATPDPRRKQLLEIWKQEVDEDTRYRICLACFSMEGDSLSQWRGYGSGSSAVAIGLSTQGRLFHVLRETILGPVIYSPAIQRLQIATAVHVYLELDSWDAAKQKLREYDIFANGTYDRLFRYLVFLKNEAFAEEKEVRLVYAEHTALFTKNGVNIAPQRFRTHRGRIVPYTTARDLDRPLRLGQTVPDVLRLDKLPITEIVVGPQESPDLLALGIARLLSANGLSAVTIRRSQVPFRPVT